MSSLLGFWLRYGANRALKEWGVTENVADGYPIMAGLLGYHSVADYKRNVEPSHENVLRLMAGSNGYAVFSILRARRNGQGPDSEGTPLP